MYLDQWQERSVCLLLMTVQELQTRPELPASVLAATASLYSWSVSVSWVRLWTRRWEDGARSGEASTQSSRPEILI